MTYIETKHLTEEFAPYQKQPYRRALWSPEYLYHDPDRVS